MGTDVLFAMVEKGSFMAFFAVLLWWTMRENKVRESKYQETIDTLASTINVNLAGLQDDVEDIKNIIKER